MTNYETNDGQRYNAATVSDLVRQLRADSRHGTQEKKRFWLHDAAYRASQSTGLTVRGDSDRHFVSDLISAGLLKKED